MERCFLGSMVALIALLPLACSSSYRAADGDGGTGATGGALEGGDFEVPGCLGWVANEASFAQEPLAHTGAGSCRICGVDGQPVWYLEQRLGGGAAAGTYVAEAWVRSAPGAAPASGVAVGIETVDANGAYIDGNESSGTAPSDQWQKITTSFTVGEGQLIQVEVLSRSPGGCFLVDDAVLYRAK